jgi:hypothetical protein
MGIHCKEKFQLWLHGLFFFPSFPNFKTSLFISKWIKNGDKKSNDENKEVKTVSNMHRKLYYLVF